MIRIHKITGKFFISLFCLLLFSTCNDKNWDNYYSTPDFAIQGTNFDLLSQKPEYTNFLELLSRTGLDRILKSGGQNTVMAVKNDVITALEGKSVDELTEILAMHVMSSAIFSSNMTGANKISEKGKFLKFRETSGKYTVNNIVFTKTDMRTLNGVVHEVSGIITPLPNIYDIIQTHPDLSLFRKFLAQDERPYINYADNVIIGYDSLGYAIFQEPIIYRMSKPYLDETFLNNDTTILSTVFLPTDNAIDQALAQMLTAKGNNMDLIVPGYNALNMDTIAGGRLFRQIDGGYVGDTISFLNNYFRNVVIRGEAPDLLSNNTFSNILRRTLNVSSDQIKSGTGKQEASNGYYYLMDEVTVPDFFYRQEFWFTPFIWTSATTWVQNTANITYSNGAAYSSRIEKPMYATSAVSYTGHVARYNLNRVGGAVTFTIPFVTKGAYKVHVSYFPEANVGIVDVKYGNQVLIENWNTSTHFNSRALCSVDTELATIQVENHGPVGITVENVNTNPTSFPQHLFTLDYIKLVPVEE